MKRLKKILVLIITLISVSGYSQFIETFEGAPDHPTGDTWSIGTHNWKVFETGQGNPFPWASNLSSTNNPPAHTGTTAAYMDRENVASGSAIDWLVTPAINLSQYTNPVLVFYSRLTQPLDQGSVYKVYISTSQTDLSSFQLLQQWSELEINPVQTAYTQIKVPIPGSYANSTVYLAFVLETDNGDRWLIDDVYVGTQCENPTTTTVTNITSSSAKISWNTTPGVSQWDIIVVDNNNPPGTQSITTSQNFINVTTTADGTPLQPGTKYKYYIRASCGSASYYSSSETFTTLYKGQSCTEPIQITSPLPYINSTNIFYGTGAYNGITGCGTGYLNNNYTIYSYTPTANQAINIDVSALKRKTGVFIYNSCNNIGVNCLASAVNDADTNKKISNFAVTAGTTYYIVVATSELPNNFSIAISESCSTPPVATFNLTNCESASSYNVEANITNLNGASSISATVYDENGSTLETRASIATTGIQSFGPYGTATKVKILLQNNQNKNCMVFSKLFSKDLCTPTNDECANAITITPGTDGNCSSVSGRITGATVSTQPNTCSNTSADVWYQFVATNTKHTINLNSITGTTNSLIHAVYQGSSCTAMTQLYCSTNVTSTASGLTIGETYKIRVYSPNQTAEETTFNICTTAFPVTCADSNPQSGNIKVLFKNLLNYLLTQPSASTPFTCPQLTALAPYITDADPKIYNFNNSGGILSFSFGNHNNDIIINGIGSGTNIEEVNLLDYTSPSVQSSLQLTLSNGTIINSRNTIQHVDFCSSACAEVAGTIKPLNSQDCVLVNSPTYFGFNTTATGITAYTWTFYDADNTTVLSTSTIANPSINYANEGFYSIKLVISYGTGCSKTFYKRINVSTVCNNCVETNPQSPEVKQLLINLINHLYNKYKNGGTVISPYTCPESIALAPYNIYNSSTIYNVTFNNNTLIFKFNQSSASNSSPPYGFDLYLGGIGAPIVDINTSSSYYPSEDFQPLQSIDLNGNLLQLVLRGINFCPPVSCPEIKGTIKPLNTLDCVLVNSPTPFSFNTTGTGITAYAWTFYNTDNTTVLSTSTSANPSITYANQGSYNIKLVITYGSGCTDTFYKLVTVKTQCISCIELSLQTPTIKQHFISLLTRLRAIYEGGNTISGTYTSPELQSLSKYIIGNSANIKNLSYNATTKNLSFDFEDNPDTSEPSVSVNMADPVSEFNLTDYKADQVFTPLSVKSINKKGVVSNLAIRHINLCDEIICDSFSGNIGMQSGLSCVLVNNSKQFIFTGDNTKVKTYKWTFYNTDNTTVLSTNTTANPTITYTATGSYLIKLEILTTYGCKYKTYKTVTVSTDCGNDDNNGNTNNGHCTEFNENSSTVSQLYINFLNSLLPLNGNITDGYTNASLTALAPYITDVDPAIYNVTYTNNILSFSFSQSETEPDVIISNHSKVVDLNLTNYTTGSNADLILTYADGTRYNTHKAKHVNFCPGIKVDCQAVTGTLNLSTGLSCVLVNTPVTFNLTTNATSISSYKWTFYASDGITILSTNTEINPVITYTLNGNYTIKLVITYNSGCTATFYKLINVPTNGICNECVETNPKTKEVKQLYIDLINHVYNVFASGGTIPQNYVCEESIALAPYIVNNNTSNAIINANILNSGKLQISYISSSSVIIFNSSQVMTAPLADIQINKNEITPYTSISFKAILQNGISIICNEAYVNFCPPINCTSSLFGEIRLGSGICCVLVNSPQSFDFSGSVPAGSSYNWTFYNTGGTFPLFNATAPNPIITYTSNGNYLIKLEITDPSGCKSTFYKTVTVSTSCGNDDGNGNNGDNPNTCTEVNPDSPIVRSLYMTFLNSLLELDGNIPNGYTNTDLTALSDYVSDMSPAVYNVNYSSDKILSFSFSQSETQPDVVIADYGRIVDINLVNYTTSGTPNYIVTYADGRQYITHKAQHIDFCPEVEPCHSHVAFVIDESGSLDQNEIANIKTHLRKFVEQQLNSGMTVSFTGMADSDNYNRTDHVYGKITDANRSYFDNWINNYGSGYNNSRPGVSSNSDYWLSGITKAMQGYPLAPDIIILLTDGSQTANVPALKQMIQDIKNNQDTHLYVYGIGNGYYVNDSVIPNDPNSYTNTNISDVTPRLMSSLKFLMNLPPTEFPASSQRDLLAGDYYAYSDFSYLTEDLRYFSDKLADANIGCGGESIPKDFCNDCQTFQPSPGQVYWLSAWVKEEQNIQVKTYENAIIKVIFKNDSHPDAPKLGEVTFKGTGEIIDGWQRIAAKFEIPPLTTIMNVDLENLSQSIPVYFDDIRVHPIQGSIKSFVYDPETFRLMAEQDDNNYSTFYEYDNEGGLVRIKKETSKGIKTIQESRSGSVIQPIAN